MNQEIVVTEIELPECKHLRYIHFDLDDGKKFCYRSRTSFNAFFHSIRHRRNRMKEGRLYTEKAKREHDEDREIWEASCRKRGIKLALKPKVVTVSNLWEFYELIGYDYKKKRFK